MISDIIIVNRKQGAVGPFLCLQGISPVPMICLAAELRTVPALNPQSGKQHRIILAAMNRQNGGVGERP